MTALAGGLCVAPPSGAETSTPEWLAVLNEYRVASGLDPVVEEPDWTPGVVAHLDYLSKTPSVYRSGAYASDHTQNPASPRYTPSGAEAAASMSLAYGADDREVIERLLTAPFHAIGLLRPGLRRSAFGNDGLRAGLDTSRGVVGDRSTLPILFPGNGSTVSLSTYDGNENPDPLESCPGFQIPSGFPLLALLPSVPSPKLSVAISENGVALPASDVCVVTATNVRSSDPIYGSSALATLRRDNAVVIIPRRSLQAGRHVVTIAQPGLTPVVWSFNTELPKAAVPTRVLPNRPLRVRLAGAGDTVVGTVTIDQSAAAGFATVYTCGFGVPPTSNVNFRAGEAASAGFVATADAVGDVCVAVSAAAHVIVDRAGFATNRLLPAVSPRRVFDSRVAMKIEPNTVTRLSLGTGGRAVVAGTITVTDADDGFVSLGACDPSLGSTSIANVSARRTVGNLFVAQTDDRGDVCVRASMAAHVIVDRAVVTTAQVITPSVGRMFDSRRTSRLRAGEPLRLSIDSDEPRAIIATATAVTPSTNGYLIAFDCGSPRPETSVANFAAGATTAATFAVGLRPGADLCLVSSADTDLVVDALASTAALDATEKPWRAIDTRVDRFRVDLTR